MNNYTYTVMAYRPDGMDTCRGCIMGQSESDFRYIFSTDIDEIVEFVLNIRKSEYERKDQGEYCKYEITFLVNGSTDWEWNEDTVSYENILGIESKVSYLLNIYIENSKRVKEIEKQLQDKKRENDKRQDELATLEYLINKYGD